MKKSLISRTNKGFTIVELLIVIVVIGILAAITIVAFSGVSQRAKEATLISDLNGAANQLSIYKLDNDGYPTSNDCTTSQNPAPPKVCLKTSGSNIFSSYTVDTSVPGAPHYKLIASNGSTVFFVTDTQVATRSSAVSATGGTITTNGGNTIHTFTGSGTFTLTGGTLTGVSVLIVGGGGGGGVVVSGGSDEAGGGGGGQFVELSGQSISGSITVTIGAGGSAGNNGATSSFGSTNAIGGGGGGPTNGVGKAGASGGGGGDAGRAAGAGTAGFSGGAGGTGFCGGLPGGGGGAGAAGQAGGSCIGGQGGIGKISTITGLSVYYAGGGAAEGIAVPGGGGTGTGVGQPITAGTPNTGGGGAMTMPGGSGVVIVRYTTP